MPTVEVPGLGRVSFPEGTPPAEMQAAIEKQLARQRTPAPTVPEKPALGVSGGLGAFEGGVKETSVPGAEYTRSMNPLAGMGDAAGRVAGSLKETIVNRFKTPSGAMSQLMTGGMIPGPLEMKEMWDSSRAQGAPFRERVPDQWNEGGIGGKVSAVGSALAGTVPVLGPVAGRAGDLLGSRDPEGMLRGAGNAVGLLAPFLLGGGAKPKGGAAGRAAGAGAEGFAEYKDPVTGKVSYRAPGWAPEAGESATTRLQDSKTTSSAAAPPAGAGPDPKTVIPLSVAERGSSPVMRQIQSGIEGTWLGKKGFQPLRDAAKAAIETRANETVGYIKALRGTATDVGNAVKEAWKEGTGEAKKIGGKMFEDIDTLVGNRVEDVQVPTKTVLGILGPDGAPLMTEGMETKQVRTSNISVSPDALRKFGADVEKDLAMSNIRVSDTAQTGVKKLLEDIANLPAEMSFGDFHRTRQEIGEIARNIASERGPNAIPNRAKGLLLKFDDLADRALMEAARKVPGLAEKVEAANAHWRWLKKATNDSMISAALKTKDPATIARSLANVGVEEVATAKKLMDERTIQAVKAQNAVDWVQGAVRDLPGGEGAQLSGKRLMKTFRDMDAEKLAAWHTPQEIEHLKYLAENTAKAQSAPAARTGLVPNLAMSIAVVPQLTFMAAARIMAMQGEAGFNAVRSLIKAAKAGNKTQQLFWGARVMDLKRRADAKFGPEEAGGEGDAGTR